VNLFSPHRQGTPALELSGIFPEMAKAPSAQRMALCLEYTFMLLGHWPPKIFGTPEAILLDHPSIPGFGFSWRTLCRRSAHSETLELRLTGANHNRHTSLAPVI
jgi:hypothetical protein